MWTNHYGLTADLRIALRPHRAGSELLELKVISNEEITANIVFAVLQDRRGRNMLSIRDQNTFRSDFRKKRLMSLVTLFLIHRYKAVSVHYVTPTDDNHRLAEGMQALGLFSDIRTEVGEIIVAQVNSERIKEQIQDQNNLNKLITKG